jgi:hypothetical protein
LHVQCENRRSKARSNRGVILENVIKDRIFHNIQNWRESFLENQSNLWPSR